MSDLIPFAPPDVERVEAGIRAWCHSGEIAALQGEQLDALTDLMEHRGIADRDAYNAASHAIGNAGNVADTIRRHFETAAQVLHGFHRIVTGARGELEKPLKAEIDRVQRECAEWKRAEADRARAEQAAAVEKAKAEQQPGAPPVLPAVAQPEPEGGTRSNWKAEIVDVPAWMKAMADTNMPHAMPDAIMGLRTNSTGGITSTYWNAWARRTRGAAQFPGVRVYNDERVTRRAK